VLSTNGNCQQEERETLGKHGKSLLQKIPDLQDMECRRFGSYPAENEKDMLSNDADQDFCEIQACMTDSLPCHWLAPCPKDMFCTWLIQELHGPHLRT